MYICQEPFTGLAREGPFLFECVDIEKVSVVSAETFSVRSGVVSFRNHRRLLPHAIQLSVRHLRSLGLNLRVLRLGETLIIATKIWDRFSVADRAVVNLLPMKLSPN